MLHVVCVLKTGGEYTVDHVRALREGVAANLKQPHHFVCLSDVKKARGTLVAPLVHGWPGWFSKLELFRKDLFDGEVFYLDLDTIVVGPLDDIATGHKFTVLQNFWTEKRIGSGLMAWSCDLSWIYEKFKLSPDKFMMEYRTPEKWGDQAFIKDHSPIQPDRWQTKHPGRVVSYKFHCKHGVPQGASIICFHGQPRPWKTNFWRMNSGGCASS